jgi:phage replication O-like protein O
MFLPLARERGGLNCFFMANPQAENGHTKIANDLFEKIISSGLNGTEIAVVLLVIRKTYGWKKKEDQISLSQFCESIPTSKQTIVTALNNLQLVKILVLVKKGNSKNSSNIWKLNKDYDTWQLVRKSRLVKFSSATSQVFNKQLVKKTLHTKETLTKENTKESIGDRKNQKFIKPTIDEIRGHCMESEIFDIDTQHFFDFYEANGWKVGKNAMKDWKAALRNWKRNQAKFAKPKTAREIEEEQLWGKCR